MARLQDSLEKVQGGATAKALADGLGLFTVEDLLRHYPRRYAERGELTDLSELRVDDHVTVLAEVREVKKRPMRSRRGSMLEVLVSDGQPEGRLKLTFFNQAWREKDLRVGRRGLFAGKVSSFNGQRQLAHPDYQLLDDDDDEGPAHANRGSADAFAGKLIPVYPATARLASWKVSQCVRLALDTVDLGEADDPLPANLRARQHLLGLRETFEAVHRPANRSDVRRAQQRLRWEEAFVLQVVLAQRRAAQRMLPATPRRPRPDGLAAAFDDRLPFELTLGQREVGAQIAADMARDFPMHRLLQGEVASGKTVVALRAMLATVDSGGQAALLAPTEVLAHQHYASISTMLGRVSEGGALGGLFAATASGTRVALLTGSQGGPARRQALLDAASGDAGIVIGTHALLQDPVDFFDLGLVVVDEQHRFGVEQRDALRAKAAKPPHVLVMTATPIPRTVAMTVFGDLEVSTLTELPGGRSTISTSVVPVAERPQWLDRAWARVHEEVAAGHQVYVVCPRIGEQEGPGGQGGQRGQEAEADQGGQGEDLAGDGGDPGRSDRKPPVALLELAPQLVAGPLAGLRLDVLHGRLAPEAKESVMRRFTSGEIDVLVATTVIEVGVDIANATGMIVMDADRFGVSQLHQLRGRVGRGSAPGLCLLVTDTEAGSPARERLDAVAATRDGFELARVDLEQRREGDVLGALQSGRRSSLRSLKVLRDEDVILAAREEASALVESDSQLAGLSALSLAVEAVVGEDRADFLEKA